MCRYGLRPFANRELSILHCIIGFRMLVRLWSVCTAAPIWQTLSTEGLHRRRTAPYRRATYLVSQFAAVPTEGQSLKERDAQNLEVRYLNQPFVVRLQRKNIAFRSAAPKHSFARFFLHFSPNSLRTYVRTYIVHNIIYNIHTYIHTNIHTHTYIHTYVRTYVHTYIHT